mgnify:CR=1 FL=1
MSEEMKNTNASFDAEATPSAVEKLNSANSALDNAGEGARAKRDEEMKKKAEAENNLKLLVGNHEAAYIGNNVVRWPTVTSQRLDTDRLKLEQPAIYEEYLKESSSRRFSVKCG